VDIGAPVGARVAAASGGTVTFVGVVGSSGLTVSQRTADGRFDLSYLHLSSAAVGRGDWVEAGSAVGAVGTSGSRSAEEPHLHFGVREAGQRTAYRDPLDFLAAPPAGTDAPEPAPLPVPVAHVAEAEAASAASPAAAPVPGPAPAPVPGVAAPSSLPVPGPVALPGPHRAVSGASPAAPLRPVPAPLPSFLAAPRPAATADARRPTAPRPAAVAAHGPDSSARPAQPSATPSSPRSEATAGGRGGIDLGWLAACLGLVAAATALGHPDQARRAAERGHAGFRALLARQ
jgi:hypothetical protein